MGQQCLIHLLQSDLKCSNLDILHGESKIIDNWVSDEKGKKVTLSKNNFAEMCSIKVTNLQILISLALYRYFKEFS